MKKLLWIALAVFAVCLLTATTSCGSDEPDPLLNGEACVESDECGSGLCLTEFEDKQEVVGGMCTDECEWVHEDGSPCPDGGFDCSGTCPDGEICLRYTPTGEKVCFIECESDDDCRVDEGWECLCLDFLCVTNACAPPL